MDQTVIFIAVARDISDLTEISFCAEKLKAAEKRQAEKEDAVSEALSQLTEAIKTLLQPD